MLVFITDKFGSIIPIDLVIIFQFILTLCRLIELVGEITFLDCK